MTLKIDPTELAFYDPKSWDLIPLHAYAHESVQSGKSRKNGKRPIHFDWTRRSYNTSKVLAACIEKNLNVGVRLRDDQLVIDIDPRNGGTDGFRQLVADLNLNAKNFPTVRTGSGGWHLYMRKPAGVRVLDTLPDYLGVEFKSKGRQVVAAGAIHPDTLKHYRFMPDRPPLAGKLPEVPQALLNIIKRPDFSAIITGGGQYDQAQIAKALNVLDPLDFREHDKWFKLMCSVHHATAGEGRAEFVEWSTRDPQYAKDADVIGRRWDSLHKTKPGGVTVRTLNQLLAKAGAGNDVIVGESSAAEDFAGIDDDTADDENAPKGPVKPATKKKAKPKAEESTEGPDDPWEPGALYGPQDLSLLEQMNEKYCAVMEGARFKIAEQKHDPTLNRDYWVLMDTRDFVAKHMNHRLQRNPVMLARNASPTVTQGQGWLEWPTRREAVSLIFAPGENHPGYLNLWTGFAVEPSAKGDWSLLQELIRDVLCDGDELIFTYVMNWLRFLVQFPGQRAEVSLVFKGDKGVGKGTLGNAIVRMIGRHALAVASADQISGRFNSHFQDCVFLFADEAVKPYDKASESRLKALITEPYLAIEGKNRDLVQMKNCLHIIMASNEEWVVPASQDERRYMVSNVNTKWQGDTERFAALWAQLERDDGSGYRRMLFDLSTQPLPDKWNPREAVPLTKAMLEQKQWSQTPMQTFVANWCMDEVLPFSVLSGEWNTQPVRVFITDFMVSYHDWCRTNSIKPGGMGRASTHIVLHDLQKTLPGVKLGLRDKVPDDRPDLTPAPSDDRLPSMELPALPECRQERQQLLEGPTA